MSLCFLICVYRVTIFSLFCVFGSFVSTSARAPIDRPISRKSSASPILVGDRAASAT